MGIFYPNCGAPVGRSGGQRLSFVGVAAAHVAILGLLAVVVPAERVAELARPFAARLIELAPEAPPPPRPEPPPPRPKPAVSVQPPPPVLAVASPVESPVPAAFTVPPQPQASAPAIVAAPAPEPPLISARFDADYLQNPKPLYPHASRRLGEEGKVMLRVFVSADGEAKRVEIKHSSGFQRLDQAAEEAVARWRFMPARRGEQAVAAWVLVPIEFSLKSES